MRISRNPDRIGQSGGFGNYYGIIFYCKPQGLFEHQAARTGTRTDDKNLPGLYIGFACLTKGFCTISGTDYEHQLRIRNDF